MPLGLYTLWTYKTLEINNKTKLGVSVTSLLVVAHLIDLFLLKHFKNDSLCKPNKKPIPIKDICIATHCSVI